MGQTAREAGGDVAQTATDQARQVVTEAREQAGDLLGEVRGQAREQFSAQQHKAVQGLHKLAGQLDDMATSSGQPGTAPHLVRQTSQRIRSVASWFEERELSDLLEEARDFARRRPGTFLLGAAVAGVAAGRLTRGAAAAASSAGTGSPPQAGAGGGSPYLPGQP